MNNENKILVWIIVLLAALNLTTIGSIFYHKNKEKKSTETVVTTGEGENPLSGRFFMQEMGFDEDQMEIFRQANRQFKPKSNQIIYQMDSLKTLIFEELNKGNVDTLKIKQLNSEFGKLHADLKNETNNFYMKLKEVSNEEQSLKLKDAFAPLFYQERGERRGNGQENRHQHRYGRGN